MMVAAIAKPKPAPKAAETPKALSAAIVSTTVVPVEPTPPIIVPIKVARKAITDKVKWTTLEILALLQKE